jgi:quercetin dioxygenase-like cupin family protein
MTIRKISVEELSKGLQATVQGEGAQPPVGAWVNGRIVAVLGSPEDETTTRMAFGMSALPKGVSTPWHTHEAEELAYIVSGRGVIAIGSESVAVQVGDAVITPSDAPHQTTAAADEDLVVFWMYAPPGSEVRWLSENPVEGTA